MATRPGMQSLIPLLGLSALLLAGCPGGAGSPFASPTPLQTRLMADPYEWDSELPEEEWNAWVAQQPQPDRPLHVVTSVPEVHVVTKYIGRDALATLHTVMPYPEIPEGDALNGRVYETFDVTKAEPDPVPEGMSAPADRKTQVLDWMKNADVIVLAGSGVDDWMAPLIEASGTSATVVDLSERMNHLMAQHPVSVAAGTPGERNGVKYKTEQCNYWWMSLRPTSLAVDSLDMLFSHMVPSKAADITGWRDSWLEQLGQLDSAIASFMLDDPKLDANSVIARRVLLDTANLAWFAYRWDMDVVDVINTDAATPPSPERIAEIRKKAQDLQVSMIITTSGYRSPAVDEIAKDLTVEIMEPEASADPEAKPAWDPNKKSKRIPVPVVELVLGLNQASSSTDDYVPFMLYNAQKLGRDYKPVIDGLYTLKKWWEEKQKQGTQPAEAEPTEPEAAG